MSVDDSFSVSSADTSDDDESDIDATNSDIEEYEKKVKAKLQASLQRKLRNAINKKKRLRSPMTSTIQNAPMEQKNNNIGIVSTTPRPTSNFALLGKEQVCTNEKEINKHTTNDRQFKPVTEDCSTRVSTGNGKGNGVNYYDKNEYPDVSIGNKMYMLIN